MIIADAGFWVALVNPKDEIYFQKFHTIKKA
ncbi:MAG: hypothetical protein RL755_1834 [Pseudomonadota bacterium]|jgi:hypothetical protein